LGSLYRLTAQSVRYATEPGLYADGGGLYLRVAFGGSRAWVFIFQWTGRRREMGLGGVNSVTLARAREKAAEARAMVADDIDPIAARRAKKAIPTFGAVADEFIALRSATAKSDKSVARWKRCIGDGGYAEPIRGRRVNTIGSDEILAVIRPIWLEKAETAKGVRTYIEGVLDLAKSQGYRTGENPARWDGHLANLLPSQSQQTKHHGAVPWKAMPAFWAELVARRPTTAVKALKFTILTAARTGEVIGARVGEVDFTRRVWTVPAERMKGGVEHQVALSDAAVAIAKEAASGKKPSDFLFPGQKPGRPLSNMAMLKLLKDDMGRTETVHGTARSSFRDWAGDATDYPREIAEMALAHTVGNAAEQAYRRGTALSKRANLMADWARYLGALSAPCVAVARPVGRAEPKRRRDVRRDIPGQVVLFENA